MESRIVYCHGLPGSPTELSAFGPASQQQAIHALDRQAHIRDNFENGLLTAFDALELSEPVIVAGFSLGAMSAVYLAARRSNLVRKLVLISPAAPLELGNFLPRMAGRRVFETARLGPTPLRILSWLQARTISIAPRLVIDTMFRDSPEADKLLVAKPEMLNEITNGLRACLLARQSAYRTELLAYVRPWACELDAVQCATEIWQGSQDDWTPPEMAAALLARLGDLATLNTCAGLGHYSKLHMALQRLD